MVMVCEDWYPIGSYEGQRKPGFYMAAELKQNLDYLIKNISRDWAFTIIISGRGEVRVGKSVLGMQIMAYWIHEVNRIYGKDYKLTVNDNFVFNGSELIAKGNKLGTDQPYSTISFDEAGADIQGIKMMHTATQDVLDYLRECGQYNMLTILVLPDFFSLPIGIAVTYCTALLDVTYYADDQGFFERGHYNFYSRTNKKKLFLYGRKERNYEAFTYDFQGEFPNLHTVDEQEYRQAKREALKKREKVKAFSKREKKSILQKAVAWKILHDKFGMTLQEIASCYQGIEGAETSITNVQALISEITDLEKK